MTADRHIPRPDTGEYAPYTAGYVGLVPTGTPVLTQLSDNVQQLDDLIRPLDETLRTTPHRAGEWTIHDILVHLLDSERIFAMRALRFARNDSTELPGFEQDDYVPEADANGRSITDILAEYHAVRQATITLFSSFSDAALLRSGRASGHAMSVRAAAYIIAGHELHHLESIRQNYLAGS